MFDTPCYVVLMIMKKVDKIEDLPQELIDLLKVQAEFEEGENFEDCEEIYDYILDWMGCDGEPKKKGEWYIGKSDVMKLGKYKIVAQYKQYIKDYDCICDEEYDCLYYTT